MVSGIYDITHTPSGIRYIGQSLDIDRRWITHTTSLLFGSHDNKSLQLVWDEYGGLFFDFSIVEIVKDLATLRSREKFHIDEMHRNTDWLSFNYGPPERVQMAVVNKTQRAWTGTKNGRHKRAQGEGASSRCWALVPQLKSIRISKHWSIDDLIVASGFCAESITAWEAQKHPRRAKIESISRLATALSVTTDDLMKEEKPPKEKKHKEKVTP